MPPLSPLKPTSDLRRYAWLSIGAAIATILLKGAAWHLTGSVGLLSDALESFVNLAGALMALWMLSIAMQPADQKHPYGHSKAEYFSSGFEGLLILAAALSIGYAAWGRLLNPQPLDDVGIGLTVSVVAALLNLGVSRVLMRASKAHASITLEADAHHLMTDVWTSVGVIAGVGLAGLTGVDWLDPVVAMLVAANIVRTGWQLIRRSTAGLMDSSLSEEDLAEVKRILQQFQTVEVDFHSLRTRQAGSHMFIMFHLLAPGAWSVKKAHDLADQIELSLNIEFPLAHVTIHVEPIEASREETA